MYEYYVKIMQHLYFFLHKYNKYLNSLFINSNLHSRGELHGNVFGN